MKQDIAGKLKKCQKSMVKLLDKIDLITTIMDSEQPQTSTKNQQEQKPEIVISDEPSVEVILSSNEREPEPSTNLKQTAILLISRFYRLIKEKMIDESVNQIEALRMLTKNNIKEDPYFKLYFGFFKIYFDDALKCKECKQHCNNNEQSINHILVDHLKDVEILICIKCRMTFSKRELLEKHILLEHTQQNQKQTQQKQQQQQQPKKKAAKTINYVNHSFNQKLDLSKLFQSTPPQPVIKKVLIPIQNNESQLEQCQEDKTKLPLFNQIYTSVDNLQTTNEERCEDSIRIEKSQEISKKTIKFKIKVVNPKKE